MIATVRRSLAYLGLTLFILGASLATAAAPSEAVPSPTSRAPRVGLAGYVLVPNPEKGRKIGGYRVTRTYHDALVGAGALPVHLLPVTDERVAQALDMVDGLVLCGGPDIDPAAYGEEPHETVSTMPTERQDFDLALAREAFRRRMPILGICLGSQELNVVLGGTLIQDIPSEVGEGETHRRLDLVDLRRGVHEITFVPGTRVAEVYGTGSIRVNSAHHQAADDLGTGIVVAARAPDGVVEAWEVPDHPFLIGVQFHPELQTEPAGLHAPLFAAFVEACAAYRDGRDAPR